MLVKTKAAPFIAVICTLFLIDLAAPDAKADLVYEEIGGVPLILDTVTGTTWTQNADLAGTNFTYQNAVSWADGLTLGGLGWTLPTATEFTSLFTQLDPYGAPGTESNKYGAQVAFGAGPNDYASNVQGVYWTGADSIDFNFFYGYAGNQPDATLSSAWAVASPESSPGVLLVAGIAMMALAKLTRR